MLRIIACRGFLAMAVLATAQELPPASECEKGTHSQAVCGASLIQSGRSVTSAFDQVSDPFGALTEDEFDDATPAMGAKVPLAPPESQAFTLPMDSVAFVLTLVMGFVIRRIRRPVSQHPKVVECSKDDEKEQLRPVILAAPKEAGSPAAKEDPYGCTALHLAASRGDVEAARALLEGSGRADVDVREAWDETALHFAARAGSTEMCELLLARGADVNAANADDHTPLLLAAKARREAVCELLLAKGGHAGGVDESEVPPLLSALLVNRIFAQEEEKEASAAEVAM